MTRATLRADQNILHIDADQNKLQLQADQQVMQLSISEAGEPNLAASIGSGAGVFSGRNGAVLEFRSISGADAATVTIDGDEIVIGTTIVVVEAEYTPTNVTETRAFDADSTSINELADVLGTLIADIQASGLFV